ncbi:MAG: GAF and ANTAR domain-containing protein [Nocardioidaceae bacterium]
MTSELPPADELSVVYARMSGLLLSQETVDTALGLVTSLATETIAGTIGAGVTLVDAHGRTITSAASQEAVERADALQYDLGEGPCLLAWQQQVVVRTDDTVSETRWPRWSAAAAELGMRASLSAPLVAAGQRVGAIKVYSDQPYAYDEYSQGLLTQFAEQAAILLANVRSLDNAERLSDGLTDALHARDTIGMAKGILIAESGIDSDAAFKMLVNVSQRQNTKLRHVAEQIVQAAIERTR